MGIALKWLSYGSRKRYGSDLSTGPFVAVFLFWGRELYLGQPDLNNALRTQVFVAVRIAKHSGSSTKLEIGNNLVCSEDGWGAWDPIRVTVDAVDHDHRRTFSTVSSVVKLGLRCWPSMRLGLS